MKSKTGSTPANNTVEILHNKKPQHHHKRIGRVTNSESATPLVQDFDGGGVGGGVVRNDTSASSNGTLRILNTDQFNWYS
jgi:hypothetical protein